MGVHSSHLSPIIFNNLSVSLKLVFLLKEHESKLEELKFTFSPKGSNTDLDPFVIFNEGDSFFFLFIIYFLESSTESIVNSQ